MADIVAPCMERMFVPLLPQRLKEGVKLDMERQARKQQNQQELEEQIALQAQLESMQRQQDAVKRKELVE